MKISIKARFTESVLFEGEYESTRHAVEAAVKNGANLYRANLYGANLYGANLVRANLDGANLDGANLVRANLYGANLYGANLDGANLDGANLVRANLYGANLVRANLDGANLDGANLVRANLYGANLVRANLDGANLVRANLDGAKILDETLSIAPLQINGLRWRVLITPKYMKIGCERHTHDEWAKFKRDKISAMDSRAWDWWKEHKPLLMTACKLHVDADAKAREATDEK